ncbi:MAG TPA: protein kinase, partial [Blastocatellia bacterium]|nr:protein kinase [Blastocatellia bacterium]
MDPGSISHYRILSKLGEGGMGVVYLAEDTILERQVALKVLPSEVAEDQDRVRRFVLEAKAASALNHPNILTVYEIGNCENSRYIATELIKGETLRKRVKDAPLSLRESLDVATQVASALSAAHGAGIIHRDIKPENIMVRPDGLVKVLDFGLAKLPAPPTVAADSEAETLAKGLTRPGIILGTLHYMSPEQVRGQPLDARSDIFSLGAVLHEMLTGMGPFDKPTRGDVIAAILTETPPLDDLPPQLQSIVARSLQKEREKRYQTSQDLLLDLKSLSRELELSDHAGRVLPQTNETAACATGALTARRSSLLHTLAILLLAGLALGAVLWFIFRGDAVPTATPKTAEVATWRSAPGEVYSVGSFSPDGARVAFVTDAGGSPNIYVKQTAANAPPVQTTKDEFRNDQPIWSPDGEEIAFFSTRGNQQGIWRVAYLGGPPSPIITVNAGDTIPRYWSKSGKLYYQEKRDLFALDLNSGQTTQLTNFGPAKTSAYSLDISPDEKQIVYITTEGERWGVWTMPARGGAARQIADSAAEIRNTVWHADSRRILYSALADGVFQIFVTDADASPPAQLTFGDKDSFVLDVAADGAKILYGSSKEESDVWGVTVATGEEFALTSDINAELWPSIAPDNKTVTFQSIKNLSQGDKLFSGAIMTKSTDSDAPPAQLVAKGFLPTWSPDGKQVAFMRVAGETLNLWSVKATGGEERQVTSGELPPVRVTLLPYNRLQARYFSWFPDSVRLAYIAQKGGANNVWFVSTDGTGDTQLTGNDDAKMLLDSPLCSSDGKSIAYMSKTNKAADGKLIYGIWVIDLETKTARTVFQAENFLRLLGWSEDGTGLIVAKVNTNPRGVPMAEIGVVEIAVASGEQRLLAKLQSAYLYNIHLSADGRMLAYVAQQEGKDNIWMMPARGGAAKRL